MASDLATPNVEQCCIIKFIMKEWFPQKFFVGYMRSMVNKPCQTQLSMIGTTFSRGHKDCSNRSQASVQPRTVHNENMWHAEKLSLQNIQIPVYYWIHQWNKCWTCWNNYPWALNVHESVGLAGPKDADIQPEGAACWCVCQTSALPWTGAKHTPRANSNLRKYERASLHLSHCRPAWNVITRDLHNIKSSRHSSQLARSGYFFHMMEK